MSALEIGRHGPTGPTGPTGAGAGITGPTGATGSGVTGPTGPTGTGVDWNTIQPVGTRVDIEVFQAESAQTNWNTLVVPGSVGGVMGSRESTGAQNAEVTYKVLLAAGTWTLYLLHAKFNSFGIVTFRVDGGASVGTIDLYNGSLIGNQRSTVAGIVVATSGLHDLNLKMETKHASSSNYFGDISLIQLARTA